MSFKISFRRLAEVRVLHSFYLENDAATPFYSLSEENKAQRLIKSGYDIRKDIDIKPTEGCTRFLKNHKIAFLPTFMGFVLAIEVDDKDGILKPKSSFPTEWQLAFDITIKNANWVTFSNTKIKTGDSPLRLYWTNNQDIIGKVMPSLSAPLTVFDNSKKYEMGEWTTQTNTPRRAQDNNGQWLTTEPYHQYATEADRRALPRQCRFSPPLPTANKVEVTLTKMIDANNPPFEAKWTVASGSDDPLSKIALDLTKNPLDKEFIPEGLYQLKIHCKDKDDVEKTVIYQNVTLMNEIKPACFGVVELVQNASLPNAQSLLNNDGSIIDGGRIFEIRLQNRITYWQYIERKGAVLNDIDDAHNDILDATLGTKKPRALTRAQMPIDLSDDIKLPSPSRLTLREKDNRFYTEVLY